MLSRSRIALSLVTLLVGCASSSEDAESGTGAATQSFSLFFAGPKAPQGGNASAPSGSISAAKAGDVISISYAPQRVRGCDGGGWAQDTQVTFLDRSGRDIGTGAGGSGFGGVGMVPRSQSPLNLTATVPPGAVKLKLITVNDGGAHRDNDSKDTPHSGDNIKGGLCSDTIDGQGWLIDIGGGSTPPPPPPAAAPKKPAAGVYTSGGNTVTMRRAEDHELRYDITAGGATIKDMWGSDDGFGNGEFVTPAMRDNDCDVKLTMVAGGGFKLEQSGPESTCASQGLPAGKKVDGTYTLSRPGTPASEVTIWTGTYVEPSPGTISLDISVQTDPLPNGAYTFGYAYHVKDDGSAINGLANVVDSNHPAKSTVSGCSLSFERFLGRVVVLAQTSPGCEALGFEEESNNFEFLAPKP